MVSSDRLPGVDAPIRVVQPEIWFDGGAASSKTWPTTSAFIFAALQRRARASGPSHLPAPHRVQLSRAPSCRALLRRPVGAGVQQLRGVERPLLGRSATRARRAAGRAHQPARRRPRRGRLARAARRACRAAACLPSEIAGQPERRRPRAVSDPTSTARRVRQRLGGGLATSSIGFSGTFGAWHGIPTLARALPLVLRGAPERALAADGRRAAAAARRRRPSTTAAARRVARAGMRRTPRCPAYLAACDVLVSPHGKPG